MFLLSQSSLAILRISAVRIHRWHSQVSTLLRLSQVWHPLLKSLYCCSEMNGDPLSAVSAVVFVSFTVLSAFVILNLFVSVVCLVCTKRLPLARNHPTKTDLYSATKIRPTHTQNTQIAKSTKTHKAHKAHIHKAYTHKSHTHN